MKDVQIGNLVIKPQLTNTLKNVHPAIGVVDGTAYVGVWLPCSIEDDKGNKEHKEMLFLVTDNHETILANNDAFRDNGKKWKLAHKPIQFENRWTLKHFSEYLKGATVNPNELFETLYSTWKKFIEFTDEMEYVYQTFWGMGTYFHHLFNSYPYNYLGGIKRAGKTKTQDVHKKTAFNAIHSNNMSPASIYRLIQNAHATLLIDETEKLSRRSYVSERTYEIRNILLSGYKAGAVVYRIEKNSKDRLVPTAFETYSPKSLANIMGLEDVTEDRCKSTILKRSKNPKILNRELISTKKEVWESIRNQLYLFYLIYWKKIRDIYAKINELTDIHQFFKECEHCEHNEHKTKKCPLRDIGLLVGRDLELWKPILVFSLFYDDGNVLNLSSLSSLNSLINNKTSENCDECSLLSSLRSQEVHSLTFLMVQYAIEHAKQRKAENAAETGEAILVQCLLKLVEDDDFYSVSLMKAEMLSRFDEEQKWITSRWIGAALRRLSFKEKKRSGRGYEYRIVRKELEDLAQRMEIEIKQNPPEKTEVEKVEEVRNWILENEKDGVIKENSLCKKISDYDLATNKIIDKLKDEGLLFDVSTVGALGVSK